MSKPDRDALLEEELMLDLASTLCVALAAVHEAGATAAAQTAQGAKEYRTKAMFLHSLAEDVLAMSTALCALLRQVPD